MQQITLEPRHRFFLLLIFFLTWLSGAIWVFEQLNNPEGFFAEAGISALQIRILSIHGALALLAVAGLGSLLEHLRQAWPVGRNRISGCLLLLAALILMITGWALYYVAAEPWHRYSSLLHIVIGILFFFLLIFHAFLRTK